MLAPQPLEPIRLASCQRTPRWLSSWQALRQVKPGARLFCGERHHSTYSARSGAVNRSAVSGPSASAVRSARATESVIWVSSVTNATWRSGS